MADGLEHYYMGIKEAPGVWRGHWAAELGLEGARWAADLGLEGARWAAELGLEGLVGAEALRALVEGHHPGSGRALLGLRPRGATWSRRRSPPAA